LPESSPPGGGWAFRPIPPEPRSIVALIRDGILDAELAATVWVLLDGRVPLVVAGAGPGTGRTTLLDAFLDLLPPGIRVVELHGATETFDWLPQASELGWSGRSPRITIEATSDEPPIRPDSTILLAAELAEGLPSSTWGDGARLAVRAASVGYGLAATIAGDSLDDVFASLRRPPVALQDDELSWLGVVLVLRLVGDGRRRVVAAHYIRPMARDVHGHLQRLGPAVLATWDPADDGFEQFGWGIAPELAVRLGCRAGDLEADIDRRRDYLAGLAAAGVDAPDDVRRAIVGFRHPVIETSTATSPTNRGST